MKLLWLHNDHYDLVNYWFIPIQSHPSHLLQPDPEIYTEAYRKVEAVRGSNENTPEPFRVARIISVFITKADKMVGGDNIMLRVAKFYRPENTHRGAKGSHQLDLNLLYWTSEGECEKFIMFTSTISENIVIFSIFFWSLLITHFLVYS